MITQFEGESRYDAIVNYFGLDMEEEESFMGFLEDVLEWRFATDEEIIEAHEQWLER